MTPLDYACPSCLAEAHKPCTRNGRILSALHRARLALAPSGSKVRYTAATRIRKMSAYLKRAERELREAKEKIAEQKAEVRRLRRLLETTDVGTVAMLKERLVEAQQHIQRLTSEVLDD